MSLGRDVIGKVFLLVWLPLLSSPILYAGPPTLDGSRWQGTREAPQLLLSGSGFGSRDYSRTGNGFLNVAWNTFDDGQFAAGGWSFENDSGQQWSRVPDGRTGRGYSAKKVYKTSEYGSFYVTQEGTSGKWFISFWLMMPTPQQSGKFFRIYGSGSAANIYTSTGGNATYPDVDFNLRGFSECSACGNPTTQWSSPDQWVGGKWSRVDFVMRDHPTLDEFSVYLDGKLQWTKKSANGKRWVGNPFGGDGHTLHVGAALDAPWRSNNYGSPGAYNFDDLYLDYTWARVEIGDAPIWSECQHKEIQIPRQWSDSQVVVDFNQGSFAAGEEVYIYLVDNEGQVSNSQRLVVPGSRGQSRPNPPAKLRIVPRPNSR